MCIYIISKKPAAIPPPRQFNALVIKNLISAVLPIYRIFCYVLQTGLRRNIGIQYFLFFVVCMNRGM